MPPKRIPLLFIALGLMVYSLQAQPNRYGLPFIKNYHFAETGGGKQNWCITLDHRGVVYVGNDDKGILEYDGSNWRTIPVTDNGSVRSMVTGEDGFIYAGLEGDFGRLEPDQSGNLHFQSLTDSASRQHLQDMIIWKTYCQNSKVYFCGMKAIFVFDMATERISLIETPENAFLSYIFDNEIYTGAYGAGIMKYEEDSFVSVPGGEFFKEKNVFGLVPFKQSQLLIATQENGLYLWNLETGTVDSTFVNPAVSAELDSVLMVHLSIRDTNIYIGTFQGGLYILDLQGNMKEHISGRQGLLNETIAQVYTNPRQSGSYNLWLAHWNGISRVEISNPFRSFPIGSGRMGMGGASSGEMITDIIEFSGQPYVSTQGGLLQRMTYLGNSRFRPLRGIREPILDLQVLKPKPGIEFLLATARNRTYVIDQNMGVSTLHAGGNVVLADPDDPGVFYTGEDHFTGFRYENGYWNEFLKVNLNTEINQMCFDGFKNVWLSTWSGLLRLDLKMGEDMEPQTMEEENGLPSDNSYTLFTDPGNQELLVGSSEGFFRYDYLRDTLLYDSLYNSVLPEGSNRIMTIHKGAEDLYWFSFDLEFTGSSILGARRSNSGFQIIYGRPFKSLSKMAPTEVFFTDADKQLWFSKANILFHFDETLAQEERESFQVLMRSVRIFGDSILFNGSHFITDKSGQIRPHNSQTEESQPDIKYLYREVEFRWSSPYFINKEQIQYSYYLEGYSSNWSEWEKSNRVKFTNLSHGGYKMLVKARNIYGDETPATAYAFKILRPWYATFLAILAYLTLVTGLASMVIFYTKNLKIKNEVLEKQNHEIELQKLDLENLNEEITAQRDEIEAQRDSILMQKDLIDRQNNAMTDSIHYARRIQDAVLPAEEVMRYLLPKHFVFYRPRDIVSGDFFWVDKKDDTVLIALADCTGHGVPGAFMSMLGISLLNEISSNYSNHPTNEIMDELRDQLIASLGQTGDKYEAKDGMEMGMIAIHTKTREIQFTGANHNLYTFQKGELGVIRGDRMPVGIHSAGSTLFSAHNLKLNRGDALYMFSDGFPDQFGGENRKKYGSSRLKKLLTELQQSIMHDQKTIIMKEFEDWKGDHEQIDDVLMIGIKL